MSSKVETISTLKGEINTLETSVSTLKGLHIVEEDALVKQSTFVKSKDFDLGELSVKFNSTIEGVYNSIESKQKEISDAKKRK
jgi:predicted regulator of Ras-like GTPase activity (Roadblock/LC7/MglB family)